jgi:hypothetical protein
MLSFMGISMERRTQRMDDIRIPIEVTAKIKESASVIHSLILEHRNKLILYMQEAVDDYVNRKDFQGILAKEVTVLMEQETARFTTYVIRDIVKELLEAKMLEKTNEIRKQYKLPEITYIPVERDY